MPKPLIKLLPKIVFELDSTNFKNNEALPIEQMSGKMGIAGGKDLSPQLSWRGYPEQTKSYALTVYDPDATTVSGFWHWAVYKIRGTTNQLVEGAGRYDGSDLPEGSIQLTNDAGVKGFMGAAPPKGQGAHRYFFVLHALDCTNLELSADASPAYLMLNIGDHLLGRAVIMGTAIH